MPSLLSIPFWQVREFEFLTHDDSVYVTDNTHIKFGLTKESVIWAFTTVHANFWHPLAWLLAVYKDAEFHNSEKAVQLAERACELTNHNEPGMLDTLAVAYAAAGRFNEAVTTAEKALQLTESLQQKQLAEDIQGHLQLFKNNQPYNKAVPEISTK